MIAYVKGIVDEVTEDFVIVDNNGIGYTIFMSGREIEKIKSKNEEIKIYTYHYVREDQNSLFGFLDRETLNMFKLLINVSGVGPKGGLGILTGMTSQDVALAIITGDEKRLCKAQGVGKKIAQRIILELKDKLKNYNIAPVEGAEEIETGDASEALIALMSLGYTRQEADSAVRKIYAEGMSVEEMVKNALKILMKG